MKLQTSTAAATALEKKIIANICEMKYEQDLTQAHTATSHVKIIISKKSTSFI